MLIPKKNILLISPFFFPEPISTGKFNTDMALNLRDKGHIVTVLCFHPFYPKWKVDKTTEDLKGIKIIRGGGYLYYSKKRILRRIVLELGYTFFVLRKVYKLQKKMDIIVPIFPPSLAFYSILPFLKRNIEKVGIIHDLQEVYSKKNQGVINRLIGFAIHKVEKKCFTRCDKLIFLSNEMKETAISHYDLKGSKLLVQYPFVSLNLKNRTNNLDAIFSPDKLHVVYSGALGDKQNPLKLNQLFSFCAENLKDVVFHFFSEGSFFEELKLKNKNQNIKFHSLVDKKNLEELYNKSTIQIVPQKEGTSKGSLPSKLPNLLASNCAVLCITDKGSEIEKIFFENDLQTAITSWDKNIFRENIKNILNSKNNSIKRQNEVSKKLFNINSMINSILESKTNLF